MDKNAPKYIGQFLVDAKGGTYWSADGNTKQSKSAGGAASGEPVLKVINSITRELEEFKPHSGGKYVTWYMCGPTVYDHSHMGHAKTYICFDYIRRIMTDYFKFDVKLCMNVTDLDDKIIIRANEQKVPFDDLSRKFETEFFKDCELLNIRLPTVVTRVSEYVPEIVQFIEGIIKNGYAYESNGSVYFDVVKYSNTDGHSYAKLEPTNVDNLELLAEGEGKLTGENVEQEKRNIRDFALWKKSKESEPFWESPWGTGRPGWHIECSAMAGEIFKEFPIDIHSGGLDLKFPHHDNEIAQSEAFYDCDCWVTSWWHTGHLHIKGKKMAKSLKNFITIKNILETNTPKQLRFLFLIHQWDGLMNYDQLTSFDEAIRKEEQFDNFFKNVKAILRQCDVKSTTQKWNEFDTKLDIMLHEKEASVREALCDNFNTSVAILELFQLVKLMNQYLDQNPKDIKIPIVLQVTRFVFYILKCFGLYEEADFPEVTGVDTDKAAGANKQSFEELIAPIVSELVKYRTEVISMAKGDSKDLLELSDKLRDEILPQLGIKIEDRGVGNAAKWKYEPNVQKLLKEIQDAKGGQDEAKAKKEEAKKAAAEVLRKKQQTQGKDFFRVFESDKYSQFDAEGIPTHDAKGAEVKPNANALNKFKKGIENQEKKYQKWLESQKK